MPMQRQKFDTHTDDGDRSLATITITTVINSNGPPTVTIICTNAIALVRWLTQKCAMERRAMGNVVVPDGT